MDFRSDGRPAPAPTTPDAVGAVADEPAAAWMARALDEIDYPMVVVDRDDRVGWANRAARQILRQGRPLHLDPHGRLGAAEPQTHREMRRACMEARQRHLRRWFRLAGDHAAAAVLPLPGDRGGEASAALVVLGRRSLCEPLSLEGFARAHGLTAAETEVLIGLTCGDRPAAIAHRHQVAMSTVRTQISSLRAKTGAPSIGALVASLATLPPMVGALLGG